MYIKTKTEVEFNTGVNSRGNGKVIGKLVSSAWMWDEKKMGCNYVYLTEEGQEVARSGYVVDETTVNMLGEAIKGQIPDELAQYDASELKFYLGFIHEMANTFGIEVDDIELLNE